MPESQKDDLPEVSLSEYAGVRSLHLNSIWVQGSMRLSKPLKLELDYVQRMMAPLLWHAPETWREGLCVQLGLGAAALTKYCLLVLERPTTVVELNPSVVVCCQHYFGLPHEYSNFTIELEDAGKWIQTAPCKGQVRLLHVDLYDHEAAAPVLDDEGFYAACRDLLAPDGVMSVNLFGRQASFDQSCQRLLGAFGAGQVWRLPATKEGNTVVVAARSLPLPSKPELQRRAEAMEASQGLPAKRWLRGLKAVEPGVAA